MRLTEAGRAFLEDARVSLRHSERAARLARGAASGREGRVRVGLVGSAAHGVLTGVVAPFRERFPEVSLDTREMDTVSQIEALESEDLDLGFLYLPSDRAPENLEAETFAEETLVVAMPASHPLAASRRVELGALFGEPFVVADRTREPGWNERLWVARGGSGFDPEVSAEAAGLTVVLGLVAAGLGVALLPASAGNLKYGGVAYRVLAPPAPTIELSVAWSRTYLSPAARTLRDFVRDSAHK